MRQHQRVGITQVLTYRLVHLVQLTLAGYARRQDLGALLRTRSARRVRRECSAG